MRDSNEQVKKLFNPSKVVMVFEWKKKRENVIFFCLQTNPGRNKTKKFSRHVECSQTIFSNIFRSFKKWWIHHLIHKLPKDETFYVIFVNVQVTSISDSIDLTLPSQFVGSETTTHLIIYLLHHVFHFQSLCWLNI